MNYTVTGSASSGDYASIGTSVQFAPGQRSVTVDVLASRDSEAEPTETVTVTLNAPGGSQPQYKLGRATTATVNVLDRKSYLYSFYGFMGPNTWGDAWHDLLIRNVGSEKSYDWRQFTENRGRAAIADFFSEINKDGNREISKAEAESADLRLAGYSWGGTQAINFAISVSGPDKRLAGLRLKAAVPIKKLVVVDPVEVLRIGNLRLLPIKVAKGRVPNNVAEFDNIYQQAKRISTFGKRDANGNKLGETQRVGHHVNPLDRSELLARIVIGGFMNNDNGIPGSQIRVDTNLGGQWEERDRVEIGEVLDDDPMPTPGQPRWRLRAEDVNHLTVAWYAFRQAKAWLA